MKPVDKRRMWLVAFVLFVALGLLLFSLRDVIREVIVIPLSYIFWVIGLFVRSTSQVFFWLAGLLIGLIVAWRSIRPGKKRKGDFYRPYTGDSMVQGSGTGRVGFWVSRVNALRLGSFYQESFNQSVSRLLLDLLSYRHHLTTRQVEQALQRGDLSVPPEIAEFVRSHIYERGDARANIFTWLFQSIREWLSTRLGGTPKNSQSLLDPAVRRVITYMEEELEVTYEQSGR